MKSSLEYMECSHHGICSTHELFNGCGIKCHNFIYLRQDWLRKQIERIDNIIVPYDYTIVFDPKVSRFRITPNADLPDIKKS